MGYLKDTVWEFEPLTLELFFLGWSVWFILGVGWWFGQSRGLCRRTMVSLKRPIASIPWTARRSNQSILKEISPECSLEGLMLKLKLQYSGHLMQRADSFE